jgi:uncharacterized membrane protein
MSESRNVRFSAVLHPHASLAPRGFAVLMLALATFSFVLGGLSIAVGFWPVIGFYGIDLVAVYVAFRVSYARARRYETVELTDALLTVEKVDARGRCRRFRLQPYWLRVELDEPPQHDSALVLSSHGRAMEIGEFLTPAEKLDFARTLRREIASLRTVPLQNVG